MPPACAPGARRAGRCGLRAPPRGLMAGAAAGGASAGFHCFCERSRSDAPGITLGSKARLGPFPRQ